jgi:hypothetical protein
VKESRETPHSIRCSKTGYVTPLPDVRREQCKDGDRDRVRRAVLAVYGFGDTQPIRVFRTVDQKGTRMNDPTEAIRRQIVAQINAVEGSRGTGRAVGGMVRAVEL